LKDLPSEKINEVFGQINPDLAEELQWNWEIWARDDQLPPASIDKIWRSWVFLGGRGAGKTRAGAEWVRQLALGKGIYEGKPCSPIALVGETLHDARAVMVEGQSGILNCHPPCERPVWEPSLRKLTWPNGSIAQIFSADDPNSLRGPQFAAAWCDELCKWHDGGQAWNMLQFGLRLGQNPQALVTTTPLSIPLLENLLADPATVTTHATTYDNQDNLAAGFLSYVLETYGNTRLGRQELKGEILKEDKNALWSLKQIDLLRVHKQPDFSRLIISVDPAVTSKKHSDKTGIIVAALGIDQCAYILADETVEQCHPTQWAEKLVHLYEYWKADCIICETNQGGDLIKSLLHQINPDLAVKNRHASQSKRLRAEPVAALYEQGKIFHCGVFEALETEMSSFTLGRNSIKSPDRLDALVWAVHELKLAHNCNPRVRKLN